MSGWMCEKLAGRQLNLVEIDFQGEKPYIGLRGICKGSCKICTKNHPVEVTEIYPSSDMLGEVKPVEIEKK